MQIHIVTGFPALLTSPLEESIVKRARERGIVDITVHDLRAHATGKHKQIDDYPYGGGPGMILKPEPIFRCVEAIISGLAGVKPRVILTSPQGIPYNQPLSRDISREAALVIICGHYKGVDERVKEHLATDEISIGDYVLSGGELPAMVIVDSVVRLLPGAINDAESANTDSFETEFLDCPYYTRPAEFEGMPVPEVLLSGHHAQIDEWRKDQARMRTKDRAERLATFSDSKEDEDNE